MVADGDAVNVIATTRCIAPRALARRVVLLDDAVGQLQGGLLVVCGGLSQKAFCPFGGSLG